MSPMVRASAAGQSLCRGTERGGGGWDGVKKTMDLGKYNSFVFNGFQFFLKCVFFLFLFLY